MVISATDLTLKSQPFVATQTQLHTKRSWVRHAYDSAPPTITTKTQHFGVSDKHSLTSIEHNTRLISIVSNPFNPIQGGGQKGLRASSLLNFERNNHRMRRDLKCQSIYFTQSLTV